MSEMPAPRRDTRLDVFRALALVTIYVNHVPGTIYENLTHKNAGFSDAAEAFVLISGIAAGFAYGTKFQPGRRLLTTLRAWRRAGVLYVAHMMTTLLTLGIFAAGAVWFAQPALMESINIQRLVEAPVEALLGLVTLGHQLGYNNILSMYAVVLLLLPGFLLVMRFGLGPLLVVSFGLWLAAGLWGVAPPNYPQPGVWFLNPLSWQFLFVIGLAGALDVRHGGSIPFVPWLAAAALAYVVVAFVWVRVPLWGIDVSLGLPAVLTGFDKTYLSAPRLLHVLAAAYLVVAIAPLNALARTDPRNPLAILGRHALPVFIAGTLLSMFAQMLKAVYLPSLALDSALIVGGIVLQFLLAFWLDWLGRLEKQAQTSRSVASKPAAATPLAHPARQPNAASPASAAAFNRAAAISSRTSL
ncbi:MAG: OpgC family protein [Mesorhizobium sp.]